MQSRARALTWPRRTGGAALVLALGCLLPACASGPSGGPAASGAASPGATDVTGANGPATVSCPEAPARRPASAAASAPIVLTAGPGGLVAEALVCIGHAGPYRFVIDTGASRSAIDTGLAASLHLARKGRVALGGAGCTTTGRLVAVPALRVGPIAVAAQRMVRTPLSGWAGRRVDGVLGSDVWGRFGAVQLDLTRGTVRVAGSEGPASSHHALVEGGSAKAPPPSVALASSAFQAPLTVVLAPGSIAPFVQATVAGHGPYAFAVGTGSPVSSLSATVGFTIGLPDQGTARAPGGIGCTGRVHTLAPSPVALAATGPSAPSGSWVRSPALRATEVPGPLRSGMVGSLGLDLLGAYGALVVDYTGATLTMGAG